MMNKPPLTDLQREHIQGSRNVYTPIEAYSQEWEHIKDAATGQFISARAIGPKVRNDLPPLYVQWKDDYKRRFKS